MPSLLSGLGWMSLASLGCCMSSALPGLGVVLGGQETIRVFVGTYTGGQSKGIYRCALDPQTGALQPLGLAAETASPSFLGAAPLPPLPLCRE